MWDQGASGPNSLNPKHTILSQSQCKPVLSVSPIIPHHGSSVRDYRGVWYDISCSVIQYRIPITLLSLWLASQVGYIASWVLVTGTWSQYRTKLCSVRRIMHRNSLHPPSHECHILLKASPGLTDKPNGERAENRKACITRCPAFIRPPFRKGK